MRRFFVIFLFLLLPLDALAHDWSPSLAAPAGEREHASLLPAVIADAVLPCAGDSGGDCALDTDEAAGAADLHDSVNVEGPVRLAVPPGCSALPFIPAGHCPPSFPPLKPPPLR